MDLTPVWLTLKLAAATTVCLLGISVPLAWWIANTRSWFKKPVSAVVSLPLVLPPTVLGFYLLVFTSPESILGQWIQALGLGTVPFSFSGLVLGSILFSLPFAVQPIQNSFEAMGRKPLELAASLGASPLQQFRRIALPQARSGIYTAAILAFSHTVGEFGVVLMMGGNIPGKTRVLSVEIYDKVETLQYGDAHQLAIGLLLFSFCVLLCVAGLRENNSTRV